MPSSRSVLKVSLLSVLLAFMVVPANAGPFLARVDASRGAQVQGAVPGGTASAILVRVDRAYAVGEVRLLPAAPKPIPTNDTLYIGCISIKTRMAKDYGCSIVAPTTIDFDPAMQTGSVTFVVKSKTPNKFITASLTLAGSTGVSPLKTFAPTLDPAPPTKPVNINIDSLLGVARSAGVTGSIRSQVAGGGKLTGGSALMYESGAGVLTSNYKNLCTGSPLCANVPL